MFLTNVARSSLEDLLLDYEDFLREHRMPQWPRRDPRRQALIDRRCRTVEEFAVWVRETHRATHAAARTLPAPTQAEIAANGALALISVATTLLDRQLAAQAADFEKNGGFSERIYRFRKRARSRDDRSS